MNGLSRQAVGYVAAIFQAIMYSSMGIFASLLYGCGMTPQAVMILRYICTTVFLGLFILFFHHRKFLSRQRAVYAQSVFFFISSWLFFLAVERIGAGLTTVLFYSFPTIVAIINVFVFKERLTARVVLSLVLSLCGVVLISGLLSPHLYSVDPVGIAFAIASCLAFAIYTVLIQKIARVESPFTATFTISVICLIASTIFFAGSLGDIAAIGIQETLLGSGLALFATIIPITLYIFSIERIGSTKAAILSIIETPSSLLLAYAILGETFDLLQLLGALFVIVSILVVTVKPKK